MINHPNRRAIRSKDFRTWFKANLSESASDIANHGADAGYPHITYTRDTVHIFERFASEIWDMLVSDADDFGSKNACDLIAGFRCADMIRDWDSFRNLLVWYACEKVAREMDEGGC